MKFRGTAPVDKVSIIRNNQYISEQKPGTKDVSFTFRYNNPVAGTSYYYLRITQTDGQTAWNSPIWVTTPWGNSIEQNQLVSQATSYCYD